MATVFTAHLSGVTFDMSLLLFAAAAIAEPLPASTDAIIQCYAQQTTELRRSHDPVEVVADAILTLCEPYEAAVQETLYQAALLSVQTETGASVIEAKGVVNSVREEGWRRWKINMRAQIVAALVRSRINFPNVK